MVLVVLLPTGTGVLLRTMKTTLGTRISTTTTTTRTTTIRTIITMFVVPGILNKTYFKPR